MKWRESALGGSLTSEALTTVKAKGRQRFRNLVREKDEGGVYQVRELTEEELLAEKIARENTEKLQKVYDSMARALKEFAILNPRIDDHYNRNKEYY